MEQFDIVIVGGGPAGLSAAYAASKAGASTLVLERKMEIGKPVHTSGGTYIQVMRETGVPDEYYHVIKTIRFSAPNEEAIFKLRKPITCVIDVTATYKYLAERAGKAGAIIRTGATVFEPQIKGEFVTGCGYKDSDDRARFVKAKVTIDASGHNAIIAKKAGLHHGFRRFGVGAEYEYNAPYCRQNEAVIVVGNRYAPAGYGWVFPWGKQRVRIGVGILNADSTANPRDHLDLFVSEVHKIGVDLTDATIVESHFGLVPSDGLASSFVGNGIMAVGDAAGQPSQIAGEGIRLAIIAGQVAGETGAKAIQKGVWDKNILLPYENQFRNQFSRQLKVGYFINQRMAQWDNDVWDKRVRRIKKMDPELVADLLQSKFSFFPLLMFAIKTPSIWPGAFRRMVKYIIKGVAKAFNS